jgi:hypothetical protein
MENKDLIPIEEIRELVAEGKLIEKPKDNNLNLITKINEEFNDYIEQDEEAKNEVKKHNRKTFKLYRKRKESLDKDEASVDIYQARFDRETWFYKRHKDTIDKYVKKDDKCVDKKKKKDDKETVEIVVQETPKDEILRIGLLKMLLIVWFDLFVDFIGKIVFFPIHLLRYVSELFFKMKKSIAVTILIIVGIVIVVVGLVFGIDALLSYAKTTP